MNPEAERILPSQGYLPVKWSSIFSVCAKVPALRRKNSTEDYGGGSFSLTRQDYGGLLKHHSLPTQFLPWSELAAHRQQLSKLWTSGSQTARIQTTGIRFPALFLASHSFGLSRFRSAKLVHQLQPLKVPSAPTVTCDNYANWIPSIIAVTKNTPAPGPQHSLSQKYLCTSRITCKSCIHTDSTSSDSAAIPNLRHVHISCAILLFLFHDRHFLTVLVPFCCYLIYSIHHRH